MPSVRIASPTRTARSKASSTVFAMRRAVSSRSCSSATARMRSATPSTPNPLSTRSTLEARSSARGISTSSSGSKPFARASEATRYAASAWASRREK